MTGHDNLFDIYVVCITFCKDRPSQPINFMHFVAGSLFRVYRRIHTSYIHTVFVVVVVVVVVPTSS